MNTHTQPWTAPAIKVKTTDIWYSTSERTASAMAWHALSMDLTVLSATPPTRLSTNGTNHNCFAFTAEADPHLSTPERLKAELALTLQRRVTRLPNTVTWQILQLLAAIRSAQLASYKLKVKCYYYGVVCCCGKLDCFTKTRLMKAYYSSFYGSELWDLANVSVSLVWKSWRQALSRV